MESPELLRKVVREYVRSQRRTADCGDVASTVDCHILTELLQADRITQQDLANRLMLDKGWISRGVDRLVQEGFVTRMADLADKRRVQLSLTASGQKRAASLNSRLNEHAASLLGHLTLDQDAQLAALLAQVLDKLQSTQSSGPSTCKCSVSDLT